MHARWVAVITAWVVVGGFLSACAVAWGPDHIGYVTAVATFALILLALISLLTLIAEAEMGKSKAAADRADAVHDCNAHE